MKKPIILLLTTLLYLNGISQVAINTSGATATASSILDISSTTAGILIPSMLTTQKNAIASPANGLMVYDTDTDSFWYYDYNNAGWVEVITSASSNINNLTDAINDGTSIFIGNNAGINDDGGNKNTAVGTDALNSNITSQNNSAFGYRSLKLNSSGYENSAFGTSSLSANTTGYQNVAFGSGALYANTSGQKNIAIGSSSLNANTTGAHNCAIGAYASTLNTTGNYNTVLGYQANYYNVEGSRNTIIGYMAGRLTSAQSRSGNIFLGYRAGQYETSDNKLYIENSNSSTPLIGGDFTSDEVYINGSVGIGTSSLTAKLLVNYSLSINSINPIAIFETSGTGNSAAPIRVKNSAGEIFNFGITSDPDNSFAIAYSNNISMGSDLFRLSSTGNLAIGSHTADAKLDIDGQIKIRGGVPGNGKILTSDANGKATWESVTWVTSINDLTDGKSDDYSIFIGTNAGLNDDGSNNQNTGTGIDAMKANTTGTNNTATGYLSLNLVTTANYNSAFGSKSLEINVGERNTAMGYYSLHSNTTGSYNTSIGYRTGYSNQTGDYNTFLGYNARMNSTTAKSNSTAIGNDAVITASNQVRIGNASVTSIGGYASWTNVSDRRFKSNISENVNGLDFILKLRPVTYNLDVEKINDFLGVENSESVNKEKSNIRQSGFIAQEVEQAAKETGYEFSGVDTPDNNSDHYGLRYAEFVVPLVKAVQELEANSKKQESAINKLNEENSRLQEMVNILISIQNK